MIVGEDDLPDAYTLALSLRDAGVDYVGIAERLGIEPAAVPSLLRLAVARCERMRAESLGPDKARFHSEKLITPRGKP